jgi:hypothetical protein
MGFFSRLFGVDESAARPSPRDVVAGMGRSPVPDNDAQAIERYRYMLRTAPPDALEQAHAEAFSKLSIEQRRYVLTQLTAETPTAERASTAATPVEDPQALARVATRAEMRAPGTMERTLGAGGALGLGASLLSSFAMGFAGSMIAQSLFSAMGGFGDHAAADAGDSDEADANADEQETAQADEDYGDDGGFDDGGDFDV